MVGETDISNSKKSSPSFYQRSQERQNEINMVLDLIESRDLSVEEMLDMIENPHLFGIYSDGSSDVNITNLISSNDWTNKFVMDRVITLSRNIDYAQSQVESFTTNIGTMVSIAGDVSGEEKFVLDNDEDEEEEPFNMMAAFMQQRVGTFVRNLGTLSGER